MKSSFVTIFNNVILNDVQLSYRRISIESDVIKHNIITDNLYSMEIISGLMNHHESTYFEFINIFDTNIWLNIILLTLLSTFIMFRANKIRINTIEVFLVLFRLLILQGYKIRRKLKVSKLDNLSLVSMLLIWYLCSTLITMAFNSVLLNTYFHWKSFPIVDNLQELYNKRHITIAANNRLFETLYAPYLDKNELVTIRKRMLNIISVLQVNIFEDVTRGKSVVLLNTIEAKIYARYLANEK